jgi:hypothetical protein
MADTIDQAPRSGAGAPPPDGEATDDQPVPAGEIPELAEVLKQAKGLPWDQIDLECPPGVVASSGAEVLSGAVMVRCNCGQEFSLPVAESGRHACPKCDEPFRHVLIVQGENFYPSATSEALREIIASQDLD